MTLGLKGLMKIKKTNSQLHVDYNIYKGPSQVENLTIILPRSLKTIQDPSKILARFKSAILQDPAGSCKIL